MQVNSNKTQNQYKIKQSYIAPNQANQEVLEPQTMKGIIVSYDGNNLKVENTKLSLSKIYENYPYVSDNNLWLSDFIKTYKEDENAIIKEEENQVIMQAKREVNSSIIKKTLYIDKKTAKPTKLEVQDMNQKMLVYILYNEIKINSSR